MAKIPFLAKKKIYNLSHGEENTRPDVILGNSVPFAIAEAYKTARTNIQFVTADDKCKILPVTSSIPGEGKTITCINTASCLAQNDNKVLLIDADMRKPQIATALGLQKSPGLSDILASLIKTDAPDPYCRQKSNIPNLDVITAGKTPPNPAELLAGKKMSALLEALSEEYDYILIDTPPVLVVTDALVLAPLVSGYVLVVRAGVTHGEVLRETVARFETLNAKICGFMLNGQRSKTGSYGRYGKYGKYGRYGKYGHYGYGYGESYGYRPDAESKDGEK